MNSIQFFDWGVSSISIKNINCIRINFSISNKQNDEYLKLPEKIFSIAHLNINGSEVQLDNIKNYASVRRYSNSGNGILEIYFNNYTLPSIIESIVFVVYSNWFNMYGQLPTHKFRYKSGKIPVDWKFLMNRTQVNFIFNYSDGVPINDFFDSITKEGYNTFMNIGLEMYATNVSQNPSPDPDEPLEVPDEIWVVSPTDNSTIRVIPNTTTTFIARVFARKNGNKINRDLTYTSEYPSYLSSDKSSNSTNIGDIQTFTWEDTRYREANITFTINEYPHLTKTIHLTLTDY